MGTRNRFTRAIQITHVMAAVAAVLICALAGTLLVQGQKSALKAAGDQVMRAVSAAETDINRSLVGLDMFLADIARWTQHSPAHQAAQPPQRKGAAALSAKAPGTERISLDLLMRAALNQNLLLSDVALVSAGGAISLSARASTPRLGLRLPPGFLDSVLAQPYPALVISSPVADGLSTGSVLYLGRSVRLQDGTLAAFVAEVHAPLFSSQLDTGGANQQLVVTFERDTGELLARFPFADALLSQQLSPSLEQFNADGLARESPGRLRSEATLLAVRPALYPGLFVSAGMSVDQALTDWRTERNAILAVAAVLLALTALATLTAQRYMRHMAQAQANIAAANAQLQGSNIDIARSLSLVQATLESTADAILVVDRDGGIRHYNRKFAAYTGIPMSVLGDPSQVAEGRKLLYDQLLDADHAFESAAQAYRDPYGVTRDTVTFKDGRVFVRHSTPQLLDGEAVGRVWCYQDITAFEQAQRAVEAERAVAIQAHAELTATLEAIPDLLFEVDARGTYIDYRTARNSAHAAPPERIIGKTFFDVLPAATAQQAMAALTQAQANGHSFGHELLIPLPQGKFWFDISVAPKQTPDGQPQRFIVIARDITQRKQQESDLRLAALVYESSSEGMAVTDADGRVITTNPAFTQITGYTGAEVLGKNLSVLNSGRQGSEFYRDMWAALQATGHWQGELWNRRKNGEVYAEHLSINTIAGADGAQTRRIALFADITQRKTQEELIWNQANYDTLTGLPNRRMFREHLDVALAKAASGGHKLALMFLDLDRFKEINDTHGHDAGDVLLQTAAQRLRGCVRESDMVARLGGDEFTLILTGMDSMDRLEAISHALLARLAEPFHLGKDTEYLSASIGITLAPDDGTDSETLIKQADQAMYASKRLGRNRCERFTVAMQEATLMRSRIARDLRSVLPEQQLWLAYQPIVDLRTGDIRKAEALVRWEHPIHGLISPATFIPIAEEAGTIHQIGHWVFETAARQVATWQSSLHTDFQVSVNKSPAQFRESSLKADQWQAVLDGLGLAPASVVIEITEGLLMDASASTREHLNTLHAAGVQISLDDFGTGYSSLSYLHQFDLDYLKIDQSFVRNLTATSKDLALCKATIVMAHELGMKVVAEGIETEEQRDLLTQAGCDLGQGYLFAKPLPAADFEALVASKKDGFFNS